MDKKQEYELKKVFTSEKAVVRVFSPIITEEERKKRMGQIRKEAEKLLKAVV